jgi:hypothetical protein
VPAVAPETTPEDEVLRSEERTEEMVRLVVEAFVIERLVEVALVVVAFVVVALVAKSEVKLLYALKKFWVVVPKAVERVIAPVAPVVCSG